MLVKFDKHTVAKTRHFGFSSLSAQVNHPSHPFIIQDFEKIEADIVYTAKLNDCDVIFYVLLEMQSKPDFSMPIRLQGYMTEIWRYYLKTKTQKEVHRKDFKLPPIIPIVLYNV